VTLRLEALSHQKRVTYPPDVWGCSPGSGTWLYGRTASLTTPITPTIQAELLLGASAEPIVAPTDVELVGGTSAGNAHDHYRALQTFFNWMVEEMRPAFVVCTRTGSRHTLSCAWPYDHSAYEIAAARAPGRQSSAAAAALTTIWIDTVDSRSLRRSLLPNWITLGG
jgi:hypothetical protein